MNIDSLGAERIKYLLDHKVISDFADLYTIKEEELIGLGNIIESEKKIHNTGKKVLPI